jgi:hypothetical protein
MDAAATSGCAETVGGDAIELDIAGGEITALSENRGRGETPRKRSCVGKDDCAAVNRIHRVEIVAGIHRDGVEPIEPVQQALGADSAAATVAGKAARRSRASAKSLVRDDVARASGAVASGCASYRRTERVEIHQQPRNVAAVGHEQVALRVHGEASRLHQAHVGRRT